MTTITAKLPEFFNFERATSTGTMVVQDPDTQKPLKQIITALMESKEVADKIAACIASKTFAPFNHESSAQWHYPSSPYLGKFTLGVEIAFESFETRKVVENPGVDFKMFIHATTDGGLPLKLELTGKPIKREFTLKYPKQFKFQNMGSSVIYQDQNLQSLIQDICSHLLFKPEISNHFAKTQVDKAFTPYTYHSNEAIYYPGSNTTGKFSLLVEIPEDVIETKPVLINPNREFTAEFEADSDLGFPIKLTLKGKKD